MISKEIPAGISNDSWCLYAKYNKETNIINI